MQKKLPTINSAHGSETRNIINELIKLFNGMGLTYEEALQKAHDTLAEAQRINKENVSTQEQIDDLILHAGESDAEVIQARGGMPLLKDRLDKNDTQLTQTTSEIIKVNEKTNRELISKRRRKPMISIIDDDGRNTVLPNWEPILQSKDFKLDIAVITGWVGNSSYLPWSELERLKETYKVDLVNHTHTHPRMGQITEQEVIEQFRNSTEIMQQRGHTWDIMVYPYGSLNATVRQVAREYVRAGIDTMGGVATPPLETFKLNRQPLIPGSGSMDSLESYTQHIDEAIENNGWIIFMSHSQYEGFDADKIKAIIDYANSKDIEWVHAKEGLDRIGNLIDIGDYTSRALAADYTVLDADGIWHSRSNSLDYKVSREFDVTVNTPINDFEKGKTTVDLVLSGSDAGFPTISGVVETFRGFNDSFSSQIYKPTANNNVYKRRWNNPQSKWTEFELITPPSGVKPYRFTTWFSNVVVRPNESAAVTRSDVNTTDVELGDYLQATPESYLPSGIFYNVVIKDAGEIEMRYFNATSSSISIPATIFVFMGEKRF